MKAPNAKVRLNLNKKEERKTLDVMAHGWETNINLPEIINIQTRPILQEGLTMVKGSNELLFNLNSKNREITSLVRIAQAGLVVEHGTADNGELRLPWQAMVKSEYKANNIIIELDHGQIMKFTSLPVLRNVKYSVNYVSNYINDQIKKHRL
ncbi:hypothetical protein [Methanobrevibacter filiformis]|uniref:Uncharacterized protein n=1 Tax=Methanobrevibacter filiformis TaxID=55758 RepID=A0A166DLM3_9EURY|nr:hypothetical protein [Methanobrevibacter filiformis]KZX15728.1 hypothetical protein MBFIL_05920 [Methanobrevibacter filiformis]